MPELELIFHNVRELEAKLMETATKALEARKQFVEEAADKIVHAAQSLAPFVSGNLRDSIHKEVAETEAQVGPDPSMAPYARRIELGFHDTDSLGRSYDQDAQPYMAPAVEETREEIAAMWRFMMARVFG